MEFPVTAADGNSWILQCEMESLSLFVLCCTGICCWIETNSSSSSAVATVPGCLQQALTVYTRQHEATAA